MKQRSSIEKAALLSLSLILISTYSVAACLPQMREYYADYPTVLVEMLISVTSFAIMCTILANIWLEKIFKERTFIISGAILVALGGTVPVWNKDFVLVFLGRLILGVGIGLINGKAVTLIQHRYEGREQATLLGFRGSMETLGSAILTFIAGRLLAISWDKSFFVYLGIIPILIMYLLFVTPQDEGKPALKESETKEKPPMGRHLPLMIYSLVQGLIFIGFYTVYNMRLPSIVIERGIGTDVDSGMIQSYAMVVGVIGGFLYGKIREKLGKIAFPLTIVLFGSSFILYSVGDRLWVIILAATMTGFTNGILITYVFNRVSSSLPKELISIGTYFALVGCNLGGSISPFFMRIISGIKDTNGFLFLVCAVVILSFLVPETVISIKEKKL